MSSAEGKDGRQRLLAFLRIADISDEQACYNNLVLLLHPDGLCCPRCQTKVGLRIHRRHREPLVDYICSNCFRVFNAWTGTAIQGVHRQPAQIVYILRRVIEGVPTARIARELGCHRRGVMALRRRLQRLISPESAPVAERKVRPASDGLDLPSEPRG